MIASLKRISGMAVIGLALCVLGANAASAEDTKLQIVVQGGKFQPAELHAPVNVPVVITIKNNDAKPMEFESVSLRVEKVVPAKSQLSVRIRPLAPGRYDFFDDFNQANRGTLVVQ